MPLGPFGEVLGTTGTLDALGPVAQNYKTKVVAPRNPKLIKEEKAPLYKLTPSRFLFEVSLNTEQKLANTRTMKIPRKTELLDMGDTSLQKSTKINIDEPMFQPFPTEIYFQNFEPFQMYEVPLVLRNNDKVPRLVKVTLEDSPYFKIVSPHDVGHKVGPGLPTIFKVQFTPDEKKDYIHELTCITEREKFVVPIKAIGARGILDFPDEIHFPTCPVKYSNTKTILVRNIGTREAKFNLKTKQPFTVTPDIGTLGVNDSMQVTVEFKPLTAGNHRAELCLSYDTGEQIFIDLYGASQDANIRLDKNSIRMDNTYISLSSQKTVIISNRSDFIAHFKWTQFSTQDEEDQHKLLKQIQLDREENTDTDRFLAECVVDPTLRDKLSILSRTFQNRKRAVDNDPQLFEDDIMSIEPSEGDIWPNSTFDINVVFKPRDAESYLRTAYCEITGRESRMPLRIRGDGMGPKVDFSLDYLDMGNIFIGSRHTYEIVLANKGDIDAIFSVSPNMTIFGPCFAFNPSEGIVMPGGHQAIQVAFSSPYLGDFEEVFCFQVDGKPEKCKITFRGQVVGPTFNFDVSHLNFGVVPIGFLCSQTCSLVNTSLVPLVFSLHVPGDGANKSVCCTDDIGDEPYTIGPLPVQNPKEFDIVPSYGVIHPHSQTKITVNFVPNAQKKYELALVVDVERVDKEILSLPISARSMVPDITNQSPVLNYGRCFLRHPYEQNIRLYNSSELAAKYEILPQGYIASDEYPPDCSPITYSSPKAKGVIAPNSIVDIPLVIEAVALEEQEIPCYIRIFGSPNPPMIVHVICVGEGPVVHVDPMQIDWGDTPVLVDVTRTILLSNESFIPASFTAHMVRPNTVFRVSPSEGTIGPEKSMELTVTAHLDDCVRFQDKLQINFHLSQSRLIPLVAMGKGTTIVSDPPLGPVLDLGHSFSNCKLIKKFKLTNRGRRIQQLVWITDGFIPLSKAKKDKLKSIMHDVKKRNHTLVPSDLAEPVFRLSPNRMELLPGESMDLTLEGFVELPQLVSETVVCHAIIGRAGGKIPIIGVNVKAEFIEPLLKFSTKCAFFRVDKSPGEELHVEQKQLVLTNLSNLPLTVNLKVAYPFSMIIGNNKLYETDACLQPGDEYYLVIEFDPGFKDDYHIRTIDEVLKVTYKEHPHIDYVSLRGEVYFPNLKFEKTVVDFGCVLNDTEVTRYVNITNNSPMEVCYHWSFLVGDVPTAIKKIIRPKPQASEPGYVSDSELEEEEDLSSPEVMEEIERIENVEEEVLPTIQSKEESLGSESFEDIESPKEVVVKSDRSEEQDNKKVNSPVEMDEPEKGQLDQEEKMDKEKDDHNSAVLLGSRLSLREDEEEALRCNRVLTALLEMDEGIAPVIGVEEVFDILPLYGCLQPGDTEQVTFTFFGHADIWGQVKAVCEVDGGPTYELTMMGEASVVEYSFDSKTIELGKQMYDHVASATITLINKGKVGFEFRGINIDPALEKRPIPGQPVIVPHSGYVEPFSEQKIEVKYLPGVPEEFKKTFQIQVAHFEPDTVTLTGEGVFPRISLDLPRIEDEEGVYAKLAQEAKRNLAIMIREQVKQQILAQEEAAKAQAGQEEEELMKLVAVDENGVEIPDSPRNDKTSNNIEGLHEREPSELEIQMEIERLAVRDFALEHMNNPKYIMASVDEKGENILLNVESTISSIAQDIPPTVKPKAALPDYLLDFEYVVLGTVRTHVVRVTNTGWMPTSFKLERHNIHNLGFHIELERVRNLPGAPDNETLDFVVQFDPRGANLQLGSVEVNVPVNILHGPTFNLCLRAHVTMPDLEVSDDVLEFSDVKCGECKVITIQLHNHQMVKCEWNSVPPDDSKKIDKHVPMHLRRKLRQEKKKPNIFEVLPPTGVLMPGQRINVQVKFMPTEEKFYENRIPIRIAQSSQRIMLLCRGHGLEPRLEFQRTVVQFGPILPHSPVGDDQEITVHNPCSFPIEFYSLEFDQNYLEEEKVLRLMKGYDEYNTLLLPPRSVGGKLPQELLDYYEEQLKKAEEEEKAIAMELARQETLRLEKEKREAAERENQNVDREAEAQSSTETQNIQPDMSVISNQPEISIATTQPEQEVKNEDIVEENVKRESSSAAGVGELEITPVSAAIARHLGIDLTPEGKAARNRRGIALIIHGAPLSGKTGTAVALAKHYEAALLTLDGIVCDAIANGNTPAGLRARELCLEAAKKKAEELKESEIVEGDKKIGLSVEQVTAHTQGTGTAGTSMGSNRKTSTVVGDKNKEKQSMVSKNTVTSSGEAPVPSSPLPQTGPVARRLSISASIAGEEGLLSCILPDDILVDIIADRLQLNDCHRGVVFDGLETLFSQNYFTATNAILKALNNRRFIYFVTLKMDYNVLKEQEKKIQEEKALEERRREEKELIWLEEMDEDEYEALPADVRARIDQKRLVLKKERIKREQKEKAERERIEREAREEEEKRKEEEMRARKGRKAQGGKKLAKSPALPVKAGSKIQEVPEKGEKTLDRPESHATVKSDPAEETKKKKKTKKEATEIVEESKDASKESDLLLMSRFKTFETYQKDIQDLLEFWDRTTLQPKRPVSPSDRSEDDHKEFSASGKKIKSKEKSDKEKKEQERLRLEKELAEKAAKEAAQAEAEEKEENEENKKEEIGIPHILVDCAERKIMTIQKVLEVIPSVVESRVSVSTKLRTLQMQGSRSNRSISRASVVTIENKRGLYFSSNFMSLIARSGSRKLPMDNSTNSLTPMNFLHKLESFNNSNANNESLREDGSSLLDMLMLQLDANNAVNVKQMEHITYENLLLESGKLPTKQEVMDGLGLGPQGPPIPPAAEFAVVPYPVKRKPPPMPEVGGKYTFMSSSPDDPNIGGEDKVKEPEQEELISATPEKSKEDQLKSKTSKAASDKGRSSVDRKRSGERKRISRRNSNVQISSPSDLANALSDAEGSRPSTRNTSRASSQLGAPVSNVEEKIPPKPLTIFRWIIPPGADVVLRLRFLSNDLGQFDQTLNFEIVGTRRRYQLFCRGVCAFPNISKEPRVVFVGRKKNYRSDEIVHKKYILKTETFEFGPLLVGKSRDKYREGKYPENMESITILNNSPLDADISFCFQHDSKGDTYLLEPPNMLLKPGESNKLTIWAYPKVNVEDQVIVPPSNLEEKIIESKELESPSGKSILKVSSTPKNSLDTGEEETQLRTEPESLAPESLLKISEEHLPVLNDAELNLKVSQLLQSDNKVFKKSFFMKTARGHIVPKPSPGHYEDALVCCIKENPEPVIFKVSCDGYRPELDLDKRIFHFDKVLLHRKDTKTIYLRNSTQLPVAWRLSGLENLGDDFTVAADSGIVEPLSEYPLHAYFRAMKAIQINKKMIRLEISDAENIMGVVHTEPIQVTAEAYDVALDMSFPKGVFVDKRKKNVKHVDMPVIDSPEPVKVKGKVMTFSKEVLPTFSLMGSRGTDGGLDFGVVKVNEEGRQTCTLKNKGKYEIAFNFLLESDAKNANIKSLFSVIPSSGKLNPQDRPTQVQVIFKTNREVNVKEMPILKCQVIEPSLGDQGEVIASIPVKVSVKAVFSKFTITPVQDINFGAMLLNSRKTRFFVIENKGEFDFKYTITKKEKDPNVHNKSISRPTVKGDKSTKLRDDNSTPSFKQKKMDSIRMDPSQSKLTLGMFTIFPAFGIILPNGSQSITVECVGETPGKEVQEINLEISDRDPNYNKGGIPYKLVAETCIPGINVDDLGSIFEEHRICKNLTIWQHLNCGNQEAGGVYGEEEKKFIFNNVIVGRTAKARFKISNNNKVPCDVAFTLKPTNIKGSPKTSDVFDLEPSRIQIANHSFTYVTISFTPPSMQSYSAMFEASIEGLSPNQVKGKSLVFEVSGEGNLPRITIAKPTVRNKTGQPLLLFKRLLVGRSESLPFELFNDGTLPSKVNIDVLDSDQVFMLKPTKETRDFVGDISYENPAEIRKKAHTASVVINPNERATFEVIYQPREVRRSQASIKVTVIDNQYEDYIVQMVGEGYKDDITLDNIGSMAVYVEPENELGNMAEEDVDEDSHGKLDSKQRSGESTYADSISSQEMPKLDDYSVLAAKSNVMNFSDCYINESCTLNLTMTSHSTTDCVRFQWPDYPEFTFSPQIGHLHAGCTKDIAVTFTPKSAQSFSQVPIQCRVAKIIFDKPMEMICDWDDKVQVVKWVDNNPPATPTFPNEKHQPLDGILSPTQKGETETPIEDILEVLLFGSRSHVPENNLKPSKKKVVETEPEPQYTEIADSARDIELLVSGVADYTKCSCEVESIHFKSTPMFQTRVYSVVLNNEGKVALNYHWHVLMDSFTPSVQRSVTFMSNGDRPESRVDVVDIPYTPFFVEPEFGTIAAGKSASCVVKFAPLDANDYEGRLICSIPHMDKGSHGPVIGLKGRSLMPYCHFELEDSDYISRSRSNLDGTQSAPIDPSTRVIEFSVCGSGVKCHKEFGIINPTNEPFTFEWQCEDDTDTRLPASFRCLNPKGEIKSGRKYKVGFEFVSNDQDVVESFWKFSIPSRAITIPFMMVGYTREPNICLDRSHLNFKSLLIGREAKETVFLTNNEDTAFQFYFVENSCHSEGYSSHIKVEPMTGQIPPKSSVPIQIYFAPKTEKEVNFNLKCNIPHKKSPLTLNVKAEGYQMNSILLCEDSTLNRIELSERGINQINFGEVDINENIIRHLFLLNTGKFNFDFVSEFGDKGTGAEALTLTPQKGGVMCGETVQLSLAFCPLKKVALKNCDLAIKVINGPTYNLSIIGQSVTPGLQFSFKSHNFGNCFIYKTGVDLPKQQIILKLINKDKKEVSVDCLSVPTSQLAFKFEACVIPLNKKKKVTFSFTPTQPIKYQETVVFEINGLTKQKIEFFGVGHEMKIEVADPAHKCVNLGAKMVGDNVRKFIPVVNNSPAPITFNLALTPTEPALQQKEVLSIAPKEQITLEANGGTTKVEVWFRPKARIPQFTEEVLMECAGMSQPLFVVKGSCLGMEINLDSDYLAFGTVYQRSSSTRKLVMTNSGDMNSKFRWDIKRFKPDFSISPVEGYITPGMEVVFDVEFHPQSVSGDVRYDKVKCFLDGGPHKAVTLTLTGSCTGIPPVKEVQGFQCVVRQTDTRQIMIPNKSNQVWNLKPVIDGEYWTGPVSFIVEPQQTKSYELTYRPLTMTSENKKHTGSIFFPLPDGSGLLFNLVGTAEPPKVLARIQRDVPCKTGYSELLPVFNWLKKTQRFRVKIEPVKPEKLEPGTTVKGVEYIDVPANGKKDYKLSFYAYKEGISTLKVTFVNEQTQEYQFYEVTFKATKPGVISTIYLATPVRQSVPYTLTLDNPLSNQVTFSISCTVAEVMLPSQLVIPAASQGHLTLEYQPLKVGEVTGRLELNCADLGQYLYDMVLNAQPSGQEKPIYFRTWLGSSVTQVAKFLNFAKQKTDYSCKIDNPDFHVEKTIAAAPGSTGGTEVALDVVFEPSKLGEQRAQLTVTSPLGSDYIFPLFGTCISPKPQGPFTVKSGTNLSIVFRNIFSTTTPFTFQVDNPLFHVAKPGESIRPHKDHRIVVGFDGTNIKNPVVGKLIVSCARSAGGASNVQWIYYLKGVSN
ncbi:hydrocephalus-inducing protein homolog isoform X5 [Biomphalaria glabrata]|uniref:Hydrocephalus-inducing protein homolog isoform X5 n=1 Tax=Biomphalaria glabrata TaxID=6526 RepID=A0A9W3B033_BIOGL|nr:hydrocephalus-inducing protein homolog isoform X5 [Biomphalaria glabrata]